MHSGSAELNDGSIDQRSSLFRDDRHTVRAISHILRDHASRAKARASELHLPCQLGSDQLWEQFVDQDGRCALSGIPLELETAMLVPIAADLGYVEHNVRWLHGTVARMHQHVTDQEFVEWCRRCFLHSFADAPRPSVHEHFMMQAFIAALRAEDVHTKHGAVIVENATSHAIGSGYNGLFRGAVVDADLTARPEKYAWMIHAEENAIMNCTKNPLSLPEGASIYVTGTPCNDCLQRIINFGIKRIYVADRQGTQLEDDATANRQRKILDMTAVEIIRIDMNNRWLQRVYFDPDKSTAK